MSDYLAAFNQFMESGGTVLWLIFATTLLLWVLIMETILFLILSYRQIAQTCAYFWQKRDDRSTVLYLLIR